MAKKLAEKNGIKFQVVSVKDNPKNVKIFFRSLVKEYLKKSGKVDITNRSDIDIFIIFHIFKYSFNYFIIINI